ncbi:hypothetical protein EDD11_007622 [Mortierella claussenii]|nr:hypothetical protein EDD11_007622 [Mortierella claussenii]
MDFFANAFVTRDKVDDENVVVKDGIQIREKELPAISTTALGDIIHYYNFLEEVGRTVDNAARENLKRDSALHINRKRTFGPNGNNPNNASNKRGRYQRHQNNTNNDTKDDEEASSSSSVTKLSLTAAQELERQGSEGSGSYRDKQLIMQARKRATHLIRMADGLKKRKENNTHWRDKPSRILWTIEWVFPEVNATRRVLEHKNEESVCLKDLLKNALTKHDDANPHKDLLERYALKSLDQCQLYFVIPLRHANQPALYPLKTTDSLQDALKFKKVLEYPTILVLGPSSSPSAPSTATTSASETITAEATATSSSEAISNSSSSSSSSDHTQSQESSHFSQHPILSKYIIEQAPTQLPKKTEQQQQQQQQQPNKNRAFKGAKKNDDDANVDVVDSQDETMAEVGEVEETDEKVKSEDSSDDSSSSSDNDSSSSDASDSDDSSSSDDDDDDDADDNDDDDGDEVKEVSEGNEDKAQDIEKLVATAGAETDESEDHANLAMGQAILEAFNQDFGDHGPAQEKVAE